MTDTEWLLSLEIGDEVAIYRGGWSSNVEIRSVDKATSAYVHAGSAKYRRANGREAGRPYGNWIAPVTQDVRDEVNERERRRIALGVVGAIIWHREPLEVLEAMAATYLKVHRT